MLISIIIPLFNSQRYISKCIDSIYTNKYQSKFELIIINDKSKDNSLTIINKYIKKHSNIKIINNKKNIGPGSSRNKGLKIAKGKYILFLDSDDYLAKNSLDNLINYIKNKKFDLLAYNFKLFSTNKKLYKKRKDFSLLKFNKSEIISNFLAGKIDGSVIFTLFNRQLIRKNLIIFPKFLHEDIPFIFKSYLFAKNIKILNKTIYLKRYHNKSIVNNINKKRIIGLLKAWRNLLKILKKEKYFPIELENYFRGFRGCLGLLITLILSSSTKKSNRIYLYIFLYDYLSILEKKNILKHHKSIKDNISKKFVTFFGENKKITSSNLLLFEEKINQMF